MAERPRFLLWAPVLLLMVPPGDAQAGGTIASTDTGAGTLDVYDDYAHASRSTRPGALLEFLLLVRPPDGGPFSWNWTQAPPGRVSLLPRLYENLSIESGSSLGQRLDEDHSASAPVWLDPNRTHAFRLHIVVRNLSAPDAADLVRVEAAQARGGEASREPGQVSGWLSLVPVGPAPASPAIHLHLRHRLEVDGFAPESPASGGPHFSYGPQVLGGLFVASIVVLLAVQANMPRTRPSQKGDEEPPLRPKEPGRL